MKIPPDCPDILAKILKVKREEIERAKSHKPFRNVEKAAQERHAPLDFEKALQRRGGRIRFIAEIKKASPSAGVIRADFDPAAIAKTYERCGAAAISVLTDTEFFQGNAKHLRIVREAVGIPILRKDFIIDRYQIAEARAWGADAVLLIVAALEKESLRDLLSYAAELGMCALVETHNEKELTIAQDCEARVLGINNRNLHTFATDVQTTMRLLPYVNQERVVVSESGVKTHEHVKMLENAGVDAILIGETLMRAQNLAIEIRELFR